MNRIRDWKLQVAQTFLPLICIPIILKLGILQRINDTLAMASVKVESLPIITRLALSLGDLFFVTALMVFIYSYIRKRNKEEVLKQNLDVIVWHSYFGYWFCRYVLNYQTVSLTRVPIPVQFQLVWKDLFKKYEYMEGVTEKEDDEEVSVKNLQVDPYASSVNLILVDTYSLEDWRAQIPASTLSYPTIIIDRSREQGVRYYSKKYVAKIAARVHGLSATVTDINLFATINTAHLYHIVNEVFRTGGRDSIKRIKVYEQTQGTWIFEGEKFKEIKTGAR